MIDVEEGVVSVSSVPVMDYTAYDSEMNAEEILEWIDDNVLEIIHRDTFTTITISTKFGSRAFRVAGELSLFAAVKKAKAYKDSL